MTPHARIYFKHFGYQIPEDVFCEVCWFDGQQTYANDIHHVTGRGKGKNVIENLAALCRYHHSLCHNEKISKEAMKTIHNKFLKQ